jgi:hypothetical protein
MAQIGFRLTADEKSRQIIDLFTPRYATLAINRQEINRSPLWMASTPTPPAGMDTVVSSVLV